MRVPSSLACAALALTASLAGCGDASGPTPAATPTFTPTAAPTTALGPTTTPVPIPSPEPVTLLWEAHGPVGPRTSTMYIAIHPLTGNLWVGVPFENRFWIFSPDGTYLESWGKGGTGEGAFDFSDHAQTPSGFAPIAFAPDGSFMVGDTGNHRVQLFDPNRNFVRAWGTFGTDSGQFVDIVTVATDGTTFYVGDHGRLDIQAFDADGNYLRTFGAEGAFHVIVVDGQGRVRATNGAQAEAPQALAIFDADGSPISVTPFDLQPDEVVMNPSVDLAGNTYVGFVQDAFPWTPEGVVQLDPEGHVLRAFEGGGDGVVVSPAGDAIYVTKGINLDASKWTFVRAFALNRP